MTLSTFPPPVKVPTNPLDEFDPNKRDKGAPRWATYCPGRSPVFKHHAKRGFALNAMQNNGYWGAVLYEFDRGRWEEVARFQPHDFSPTRCEVCFYSTEEEQMLYDFHTGKRIPTGRIRNVGRYDFVRKAGKVEDPAAVRFFCSNCYQANS